MRYSDDIISFDIPKGFSNSVKTTGPGNWRIDEKSQSFVISIDYPQLLEPFVEKRFGSMLELFQSTYRDVVPYPLPGYANCVCFDREAEISKTKKRRLIVILMQIGDCVLDVTFHRVAKKSDTFSVNELLPIINGISLDFTRFLQSYEEYCIECDMRIVKLGQKRREKIAASRGLTEELCYPNLRRLEEKYDVDYVRDGDPPGEKPKKKPTRAVSARAQKILDEMDAGSDNPYRFLPDLEHGYFYTAGSRITLFGDEDRWAVAFEKTGYANRGMRVEIEVDYFGNCLSNLDTAGANGMFVCNKKSFSLVETTGICDDPEVVSPEIETITIRGERLPIPRDPKIYKKKKIELDNPEEIGIVPLIRLLDEAHPELFRATEEELRTCIPTDLPKIMVIDKWHQPAFNGDDMRTKPSEHETFRLIAEVLASLDPSKWKPKKKPNNDWRNWPEAGGL